MAPFEEALGTIREAWRSNGGCLDDLKERLTGAQPIPLLPFVGAGLSMDMGFPSWAGFLEGLAAECGKSGAVAALLGEGKYEEAAEAIERGLSQEIFSRRIAHTFGKRRSDTCELKGAVLALAEMAAGAVVTTNFDRILERVFREAGSAFEHVVWGSQVDSIRQAIAENKPFLLKIHGDAEERSGRVLTKREYEKHYTPGDPEGLRAQLARIFQGRTVLFLGCSLGKDRTMDVLSELLRQASGLTHFAVVEKPAREDELFAKQQLLGQRGILPIFYPIGRHVCIRRQLASQRPDAFLPDLATSLGAMGAVLQAIGNAAEAAATFREGVERLKPLFLRLPKAFRLLMENLIAHYFRASQDAGLELDAGLLADIVPLLSDVQAEGGEE